MAVLIITIFGAAASLIIVHAAYNSTFSVIFNTSTYSNY